MNYIRHLSGFFARVAGEDRLNPTHISLYMGLFQYWNLNRFVNPISISRSDMMSVSKICSKATYHKVMKDLHELGFIKYEPSYNPFRGSAVTLINLEEEVQKKNRRHTKNQTSTEQAIGRYHTKKQESTVLLNEPYINNTNIINSKHCKQHQQNETDDTSSNFDRHKKAEEKKPVGRLVRQNESEGGSFSEGRESSTPGPPAEASAQDGRAVFFANRSRKETRTTINQQRSTKGLPLSVEEVKIYFAEQKSTSTEAEKFFNYFQSNGWKVGGRAPMKDWQAAARNWILNSNKFYPEKSKQNTLHVSTTKDYSEPL